MLDGLKDLWRMARVDGWIFTNATFVAAEVEVDAAAAARWLPGGLRLASPATATLFVAHYPETSFGSVYNEAGLFLDVRRGGRAAVHCPWMVVDDDVALILGREALGYPKKMAALSLSLESDDIEATVERRGVRLLELRGKVGRREESPPPMLARRACNVWGTMGLSLQRLLSFTPREQILEAREVEMQIEVRESARDPLHELKIGRVLRAYRYRLNIGGAGVPLPVRAVSPLFMMQRWALRYS